MQKQREFSLYQPSANTVSCAGTIPSHLVSKCSECKCVLKRIKFTSKDVGKIFKIPTSDVDFNYHSSQLVLPLNITGGMDIFENNNNNNNNNII